MALLKKYFELTDKYLKEKGEKTVVLMQVGAFFEVYGKKDKSGNIYGSKIVEYCFFCELAQAYKSPGHIMAGFRDYALDKYLKKIQDNGYTAVVYTQDTPSTNTTRSLQGIYSPGTYFSYDQKDITNNVSCIWISEIKNRITKTENIVIGMSNIDIYTGRSNVFETVVENLHNPTTYDELERYLSSNNPSELIIISNLEDKKIQDVLYFINNRAKKTHIVSIENKDDENTKKALNCEKQIYREEVLKKFFNLEKSLFGNILNSEIATQSFIYLLDFIYEHNADLVYKIKDPEFENSENRVILANHSLKQLNIIEDSNYTGKYSCVLNFLNNCITPMGTRRFKHKLLHPIFCKQKLEKMYDITEYLLNEKTFYESWRKELKEIKDIEKLNRQIILKKISPLSIYQLFNNLQKTKSLFNKHKKDLYLSENFIKYKDINKHCDTIKSLVERYFDIQLCKDIDNLNFDKNFINQGISKNLDDQVYIYETSKLKLESIRVYLDNLIGEKEKTRKEKNSLVKIHETEKIGLNLITTKRRSLLLKSQIEKMKEKDITLKILDDNFSFNLDLEYKNQSTSNVFILSKTISEICNNIISSKNKMRDEITIVYYDFIDKLKDMDVEFKNIIDYIILLDLLQNQCYIAESHNYCKPTIKESDTSFVDADKMRHCLIENLNRNENYVTNSISLGNDCTGLLLFGTNAVGKTSFIKSLGICIIMAQSGLYVPCSSFTYYPYKSLFTRILGNDNIFKGLSTFGVEMSELRIILRLADSNSLILGDELCSGTEHDSAKSIFVSGLNELDKKMCSYIFATHLHEIVEYSEIKAIEKLKMKHMLVRYDREKDLLIYDRILRDGCGESMYGLEVCESLHMPSDFLENAKKIRNKYVNREGALSLKTSHFNQNKIKGKCEICNENDGHEVHHLLHQKNIKKTSFITKNHLANLVNICKECHDKIHKNNKQHKKIKTDKGFILEEI